MGKTFLGGQTRRADIQLLSPDQQRLFSQLGTMGPAYTAGLQQMAQGLAPEQQQQVYEQSYLQPALQALQEQIAPAIQQRFVDAGAGSSSALNQALARAAADVSTGIGSGYGQFLTGQQGLQQNALAQMGGLLQGIAGQRTFEPHFQRSQGILGPILMGANTAAQMYRGGM